MLEPVILSDAILDQARLWRDECLRHWNDQGTFLRIGEATFTSPVDSRPRTLVLHLASGFCVKGKTFIGILSETCEVIGEGYSVILNRERIGCLSELMPILLHELTHAIDPYFDEDMRMVETAPEQFGEAERWYDLRSEQRAFAAMWTEQLREDLAQGQFRNPIVSMQFYRNRSAEFRGFYDYGQHKKHDLWKQIEEHFQRIVADLKRR